MYGQSLPMLEICLATIGVGVVRCDDFGCRTFIIVRGDYETER